MEAVSVRSSQKVYKTPGGAPSDYCYEDVLGTHTATGKRVFFSKDCKCGSAVVGPGESRDKQNPYIELHDVMFTDGERCAKLTAVRAKACLVLSILSCEKPVFEKVQKEIVGCRRYNISIKVGDVDFELRNCRIRVEGDKPGDYFEWMEKLLLITFPHLNDVFLSLHGYFFKRVENVASLVDDGTAGKQLVADLIDVSRGTGNRKSQVQASLELYLFEILTNKSREFQGNDLFLLAVLLQADGISIAGNLLSVPILSLTQPSKEMFDNRVSRITCFFELVETLNVEYQEAGFTKDVFPWAARKLNNNEP